MMIGSGCYLIRPLFDQGNLLPTHSWAGGSIPVRETSVHLLPVTTRQIFMIRHTNLKCTQQQFFLRSSVFYPHIIHGVYAQKIFLPTYKFM